MPLVPRWCSVLLAACVLAGCAGGGADTGELIVPYQLGNRRGCAELGVESVRAELDGGAYAAEADCDRGEVRFHLLDPGRYEIVVFGLDAMGVPVMDSLASGPAPIDVVGSGTTVVFDPPIKLTAAPARLRLRWEFGFGSCESAAIDRFDVSAWRSDGSELLMESEVSCGLAGEGRDQYRSVPDPDRDLSGDEVGEIEIQPYDRHGLTVGDPVLFVFDSPGAGREIRLSLSCDSGGCESSGEPDG